MNQKTVPTKRPRLWRLLATLTLVAIGLWLVAANWHTFRRGFTAAAGAQPGWILAAFALTCLTFLIAAAIYRLLSLKAVCYRQLLLVELAAAFANRLLPAGLGGLSLHGLYLYHRKHTAAEATAVVSVNNLLGITAHLFLLFLVVCFRPSVLHAFTRHTGGFHWWYVGLAAGVVLLFAVPKLRRALAGFLRNLLKSFGLLKPRHLAGAFVLALLLTTTYTLILYAAAHAVGLQLGVLQVFIVFSLGMLVGTATPTPGGLVGVEAGLYGGFVGYGATSADAAAAVIVYRLLTYWLPLVPGCIALLVARSRRIL